MFARARPCVVVWFLQAITVCSVPCVGHVRAPYVQGPLRGRGCGCYRWPCVGNGRLRAHRRSHPPLSFRPLGVLAATTISLNGRPIVVTAASVAPSATSRIPLLQELIVRDAGPFLVPGVNVVTVEVWAAVSRVSSLFDLRMDLVSLRRVRCRRPSTPRLPYAHVLHGAVDVAAHHICVCCVVVWMGFFFFFPYT